MKKKTKKKAFAIIKEHSDKHIAKFKVEIEYDVYIRYTPSKVAASCDYKDRQFDADIYIDIDNSRIRGGISNDIDPKFTKQRK